MINVMGLWTGGPRFEGKSRAAGAITQDAQGHLVVPDRVCIPAIAGDGIGLEIMPAAQQVVDAAVKQAYQGKRAIQWLPVVIGEQAMAAGKKLIPDEVLATLKKYRVSVKGPVRTPVSSGFRSVNVALRNLLDLFACIRPVKFFQGVYTNMKQSVARKVDVVLFRENTEDLYKGVEFAAGSPEAQQIIDLSNRLMASQPNSSAEAQIDPASAIGLKPMSEKASKRIIREAIAFALKNGRPSVTVVGKGNIMKETEGAFLKWAEEVAAQDFGDRTLTYSQFRDDYGGNDARVKKAGKVVMKYLLTDAMFQEVQTQPYNHHVVVTSNLNGDLLSDAFAGVVGGLGIAPGRNVGADYAMFEATHGTADGIAGKNIANPTALLLSMEMMLRHLGWEEAAALLQTGVEKTIAAGQVTRDVAKYLKNKKALSTTEYAQAVIQNLPTAIGKAEK